MSTNKENKKQRKRTKSEPPPFSGDIKWTSMPLQEIKGKEKYKINIGHKGLTEDEVGFVVSFKESHKKKKFNLALGRNGVRLLEVDSDEEIGRWNYKDIKNFSYNSSFHYFQFSTSMNDINVENFTFKCKQCSEMFDQVKLFLAENLKKKNDIGNPEDLIKQATHQIENDAPKKKLVERKKLMIMTAIPEVI